MERTRERLAVARKALATLAEVVGQPNPTKITRDAAIQRFEYTFEAVWKAGQSYSREIEGIETGSPKGAVRAALQTGLLREDDVRGALAMADDRNETVHTYNEALADAIYKRLAGHVQIMDRWLEAMEARMSRSERL